jgi:Zn-dependent protease
MIDLLLVLFTLALLVLTQILRVLLAFRLPAKLKIKPANLKRPPDIMADLFDQTDQALTELGFSQGHWAIVHPIPELPGFTPPLMRLYHHKTEPIIARVSPPHTLFTTDRCQVVFLSVSKRKTFLATANRILELFPRPPEDLSIMLNTRADSLAEQFQAHQTEMAKRDLAWRDRSKERGELVWSFHLAYRYEKKCYQWLTETGHIRILADGSAVPRLPTVLRFLWRFVTGREKNPPREHSPLPSGRAAYLFQNWRRSQQLPPPVSTQLGLFTVSALAFVLLAGAFWDWAIALILVAVIAFHEAGHWLTMRLLGYRNLQILMMPLVGGVTLGQEKEHQVSHRILISLMGPLPGIILGTFLVWFFGVGSGWLSMLGIALLVINYFNLLPVLPLDGGQIVKALIPINRFGLLISLEWLGAAALLLLGWLTGSLFLAALALVPFFSGLALSKRKKIFKAIDSVTGDTNRLPPNEQIASVIQAIDQIDKAYRPLEKKAAEITDILSTLRLKPATSATATAFLVVYLAIFFLPPIAAYTTSPGLHHIVMSRFSDSEAIQQEAHDRAMTLPMPELVSKLAEFHRHVSGQYRVASDSAILRQPATGEALALAEARLGSRLDKEYRQFLETSNGYINLLSLQDEPDYLLFPVERVGRFAQQLPEIVTRLHDKADNDKPPSVHVLDASATIETEAKQLELNQIAHMLYIGNLDDTQYLLLDTPSQPNAPANLLILFEYEGGLEGTRWQTLRHYLADDLAAAQVTNPDLSLSD